MSRTRDKIDQPGPRSRQALDYEAAGRRKPEILDSLFGETVALFHRLRAVADQLYGQGEMSGARRGVLRSLDRLGPQTVPQMARARPVSRQHIQAVVNPLVEEGFVEFIDNPAHKRSHLVRLTPKGKESVGAMNRREAKLLGKLGVDIPQDDLLTAVKVLRAVRESFESPQWKRILK